MNRFQSTVSTAPAQGVPGDKATLNPVIYAPGNTLAEGPVTVGRFVWATANGAARTGSGQPLGLVERRYSAWNRCVDSPASQELPKGSALAIARRGDFFAVSATAAQVGHAVFASLADGSIATAAPGSSRSGEVETPWRVLQAAPAGEIMLISNW